MTLALRPWLAAHRTELRQAVRTTVAALLALALGAVLGLTRSYWAVLTAVIVTQASVGGSIKASVDRLIGTVSGALYGALVAAVLPPSGALGDLATIALAVAPLALAAALNPSFRIAPATALIVLLTPGSHQAGALHSALDRVLEIGFGCLIGLACSLTVLPARASRQVGEAAATMTGLIAELLRLQLVPPGAPEAATTIQALQNQVRAALRRLEAVAAEAQHERRATLAAFQDPAPVHRTLLRLRHDLVMIGRATTAPLPAGEIAERLAPPLAAIAAAVGEALREAGAAFSADGPAPVTLAAREALAAYGAALQAIRAEGLTRPLPAEAVERLYALGFALDQLGRDLEDLAERAAERRG